MQYYLLRAEGAGVLWGLKPTPTGARYEWNVTNRSSVPVRIRSVRLVFDMHRFKGAPQVFRNGYQSWSASDVATFGTARDPSFGADNPFFQAAHHADADTVANEYELRSEWVTVIGDDSEHKLLVGFVGSGKHDGTLRLTHGVEGDVELHAEAFLGGVELGPGESFQLDPVVFVNGTDVDGLLAGWADEVGAKAKARVDAPFQVGWCSWYHYFDKVTEHDIRANLARAADFPFEVFQIDDGYQSAIGDWLTTNDKFPSGLNALAHDIAASGYRPGIWLAPFLVAPDSHVARDRPDWIAQFRPGKPLKAWVNPAWGGFMYALDTSNPAVLDHLEALARALKEMGFSYLKLDFTFAPSFDGIWHDPKLTPAQRVRAGFDAIRRGAGDDAFILGCGVPLAHVVGVVDGNRIGPDVAPLWEPAPETEVIAGYLRTQPATKFAQDATRLRAFMHRRFWLNDPDCLMLRTTQTRLSDAQVDEWARTVGESGGMVLVSDDLSLLSGEAAQRLRETIATGRAADDRARRR
ncbi:MAG TPA: glycoside hydrolase family 36 protein [Acidimicrobiales bacterium]|nr:glycoside hydrolase family 36 protein [Acidimicrobiales bacterium]